ncbi:MAG: hypothetical protein P4L53_04825 [Candidatus Obscuribacterales bacterium]|nr:hypothetical protein [Candidatus Obscuribacterales bacterium]
MNYIARILLSALVASVIATVLGIAIVCGFHITNANAQELLGVDLGGIGVVAAWVAALR